MKIFNLLLFLFLCLIGSLIFICFCGCSPKILLEKETIKEIYFKNPDKIFLNKQIFPVIKEQKITQREHSLNTPEQDFNLGIMYKENAYSNDNIIHNIDVSSSSGNKQALFFLRAEVIEGCQDENFIIHIRPFGSTYNFKKFKIRANEPILFYIMSNKDGKFEWFHNYEWPFWMNPNCASGYEIYKWIKIKITAVYMIVGNEIN